MLGADGGTSNKSILLFRPENRVAQTDGVTNESQRAGMRRAGDPRFARLAQLLYELQLANALQIRIERSKDNSEISVIGSPLANLAPDVAAKVTAEVESRRPHVETGDAT